MEESINLLKTSLDIWLYLKKKGSIQVKKYDAGLIDNLRKNLNLPEDEKFENQLSKYSISNEFFIEAFFKSIQPYSEMMHNPVNVAGNSCFMLPLFNHLLFF